MSIEPYCCYCQQVTKYRCATLREAKICQDFKRKLENVRSGGTPLLKNSGQDQPSNKESSPTRKEKLTGGPTRYYDLEEGWRTLNDIIEYKSKAQWKEYSAHLKDILKACWRWNNKDGTTITYDAKKIVYFGLRLLYMMHGRGEVQKYLQELTRDRQFK